MKGRLTLKDVLHQLKEDLIGKDSYRGVTLTYAWMANQFGHFSLGFIPTLIVHKLLLKYSSINNPELWSAVIISVMWLAFELYNFLGPLLLKKQTSSKAMYVPSQKPYVFRPAWGNVAFDTFTDLCFFWLGAFASGALILYIPLMGYVIAAVLFILVYPCRYWFLTKMYLQYAKYPYQMRLSQWNLNISEEDRKQVLKFMEDEGQEKHLLIFGEKGSGRTSLSVGIGTEHCFRHVACSYTTGMKLFDMFSVKDDQLKEQEKSLWTWRTSALLVIDDINPGTAGHGELVTAAYFMKLLTDTDEVRTINMEAMRNRKIVWVMGEQTGSVAENYASWEKMLTDLGVSREDILSVGLLSPA